MAIEFPSTGVDRSLARCLETNVRSALRVDDILSPVAIDSAHVEVDFDIRRRAYIVGVAIPHIHYFRQWYFVESSSVMVVSVYSMEVARILQRDLNRYMRDPTDYFHHLFELANNPVEV
jgi:hypothetical protein